MNSTQESTRFWRNFRTVLSGTALAQLVPVLVLPLLTRLVSVEDLGEYFLWVSCVTVLTVAATGRLDMAVFSAETDEIAIRYLRLLLLFSVGVSGIALIGAFSVDLLLPAYEMVSALDQYRAAWVLATIGMAANQGAIAVFVYRAEFRASVTAKVVLALAVSGGQLALCLISPTKAVLVYAHAAAVVGVGVWLLWRVSNRDAHRLYRVRGRQLASDLRTNFRFPVFAMPADFLNVFASQLPIFLIVARYGDASVALYALTLRVLQAPVGLMAGSVLTVFKERAARDYRAIGNCVEAYRHAFRTLVMIGILPGLILLFYGQEIIVLIFGQDWLQAGLFVQILAPLYFMKFVASPLSYTLYISNQQLTDLIWQMALFVMTWAVFALGSDLEASVGYYSAGYSFLYIVYLGLSYRAARASAK